MEIANKTSVKQLSDLNIIIISRIQIIAYLYI